MAAHRSFRHSSGEVNRLDPLTLQNACDLKHMQPNAPETQFGHLLEILVAACDLPESVGLKSVKPELLAIQKSLLEGGDDAEFSKWLRAHPELHGEIVYAVSKNCAGICWPSACSV